MKDIKKLLPLVALTVLLGCTNQKALTTNAGGSMGLQISEQGVVSIDTSQPENPNSAGTQTVKISKPDGLVVDITQSTGGAFENKVAKLLGVFKQCKIYHIGAILCVIIGALILSLSKNYKNAVGWGMFGAGGVLFVLGGILPDLGTYLGIGALSLAVLGGLYIYHKKSISKAMSLTDFE